MKKIILTIFCVLCLSFTAMAKEYHSYEIKTCGDLMCDLNGRPITGSVKNPVGSYNISESFYINGMKEKVDLYANGIKKGKLYCENKKTIKSLEFFDNGNLQSEMYYKNGKIDGNYREYDISGNLIREIPYKNGKRHGIEKIFENNEIVVEAPFINGILEGNLKLYESGKHDAELGIGKISEIIFQNGNAISGHDYTYKRVLKNGHITLTQENKKNLTNAHLYNIQKSITPLTEAEETFIPVLMQHLNMLCEE